MYVFEVLGCGKANYNYFDTCANQWILRSDLIFVEKFITEQKHT